MRRVLLAWLVWSASVVGQSQLPCSQNCQLARDQPFSVVYSWAPTTASPDIADGFRLYRNGVVVAEGGQELLKNGVVSFSISSGIGVAGSYSFAIAAYTATGGEAVGDPVMLTILKGRPARPTSGRVQ